MQGLIIQDFERKLKKLNPRLWIDHTKISYPYLKEYPTCGLYLDTKFIAGVPQYFIPEYSVAGIDLQQMADRHHHDFYNEIIKTGLIPEHNPHRYSDRLLWRGSRVILAALTLRGNIDQYKAQKLFRHDIHPRRLDFPKHYVQLAI